MKILLGVLCSTFLSLAISLMPSQASGACTYSKNLRHSGFEFNVSSRSAVGCGVQVVSISVRRGGRNFAALRADVDYLAENAWAADLEGDGRPELVVASRSTAADARGALDVYQLKGNVILRSSLTTSNDPAGYRGGDKFRLDGRRIVRTMPIHTDSSGNSQPDSQTEIYEFSKGKLTLSEQQESAQPAGEPPAGQTATAPTRAGSPTAKSSRPALTGISVGDTAIEITADSTIGKYRTMRLNNPERLAIDFPAASSPLSGKMISIGNFGIKRVRIGLNKGFVRIVLDSDSPVFPEYSITTSDSAMKVVFSTK